MQRKTRWALGNITVRVLATVAILAVVAVAGLSPFFAPIATMLAGPVTYLVWFAKC